MDSLTLTKKQLGRVASEVEHYAGTCAASARYTARRLPSDSEQLQHPGVESAISMAIALDDKETSFPLRLTLRISVTQNNDMPIGGYVTFKSIPGCIKKMVTEKFKDQPITTEDGLKFSTDPANSFVIPVRSGRKSGYFGETVYDATVELTMEK